MILKDKDHVERLVRSALSEEPVLDRGTLAPLVTSMLARREEFLELSRERPTPFYVFDHLELARSLAGYLDAFSASLPGSAHFYAMKVNHHPFVVGQAVEAGFGLDVSSGKELGQALSYGSAQIVYSGPGKTVAELSLAASNADRVIVNIDSFRELEKLGQAARACNTAVRAGVRIFIPDHGSWSKFGIPLPELARFWREADRTGGVRLEGIQFHISWNRDAEPYEQALRALGEYLSSELDARQISSIRFVDIGGGFRPYRSEGFYPWKTRQGAIAQAAGAACEAADFPDRYYLVESVSMPEYARGIGRAVERHLKALKDCRIFTEPGRVICNNSMHVLLRVEDIKAPGRAILDGGINIVGWERFEHDYFPLINLSRPSVEKEIEFDMYGCLCMPQDLWGYYVYGESVQEGDIILVPCQGALTFSLAQDFIKGFPEVHRLKSRR